VPVEILQEKLKTELRGINRDVIAEYFKKLDDDYKANLNKEAQFANQQLISDTKAGKIDPSKEPLINVQPLDADGKPIQASPFFRSVARSTLYQ
jgi:hypothetical protein